MTMTQIYKWNVNFDSMFLLNLSNSPLFFHLLVYLFQILSFVTWFKFYILFLRLFYIPRVFPLIVQYKEQNETQYTHKEKTI